MKKTAFTLAELIIVMGILGFIAIIVLSQTKNIVPNENMAMFKKAYSVATQIVTEMVDDDDLYPETDSNGDDRDGFDNVDKAVYKTDEHEGNTKFCYIFGEMLNTISDLSCDEVKTFTAGQAPEGNFTTSDGIVWSLPLTNFDDTEASSISIKGTPYKLFKIFVDINGENEPNCLATDSKCDCESSTKNTDGSRQCNKPEPDRMTIYVTKDGAMFIPDDSVEEFYIKSEKSSAKYHTKKVY